MRVDFYHETDRDRERRLSLIRSICGDHNPISWKIGFPPVNVKLKRTDWQILKALRKDSMQSNVEIANKLGVSPRTVKRRLSFMTEARAIYSHTPGDVKRVPGMAYFFLVDCANEKKKHELDDVILSKLQNAIYVDTRNKQYSTYAAVFPNIGEADETHRWLRSLDGGENTRMYMMREIITIQDWVDNKIAKCLNESG